MGPTGPIPAVGWNNSNNKKVLPLYRGLLIARMDSTVLQLMHQLTHTDLSLSEQGVPLFLFCDTLHTTHAANRLWHILTSSQTFFFLALVLLYISEQEN